jgi:hypothetical protein
MAVQKAQRRAVEGRRSNGPTRRNPSKKQQRGLVDMASIKPKVWRPGHTSLHKKHTGASANYARTQEQLMAGIATDQFTKGILDKTDNFGGWTNATTRTSSTPPRLMKETTAHRAYCDKQREYHANDFKISKMGRRFSKVGSYRYRESRVHKCDPGPCEFQPIGGFNTLSSTGGKFNQGHSKTCTEQAIYDQVGCVFSVCVTEPVLSSSSQGPVPSPMETQPQYGAFEGSITTKTSPERVGPLVRTSFPPKCDMDQTHTHIFSVVTYDRGADGIRTLAGRPRSKQCSKNAMFRHPTQRNHPSPALMSQSHGGIRP